MIHLKVSRNFIKKWETLANNQTVKAPWIRRITEIIEIEISELIIIWIDSSETEYFVEIIDIVMKLFRLTSYKGLEINNKVIQNQRKIDKSHHKTCFNQIQIDTTKTWVKHFWLNFSLSRSTSNWISSQCFSSQVFLSKIWLNCKHIVNNHCQQNTFEIKLSFWGIQILARPYFGYRKDISINLKL